MVLSEIQLGIGLVAGVNVQDILPCGFDPFSRYGDTFFTNTGHKRMDPNPDLIVNGQKGIWRILSCYYDDVEWNYLTK